MLPASLPCPALLSTAITYLKQPCLSLSPCSANDISLTALDLPVVDAGGNRTCFQGTVTVQVCCPSCQRLWCMTCMRLWLLEQRLGAAGLAA